MKVYSQRTYMHDPQTQIAGGDGQREERGGRATWGWAKGGK